MSLLKSFLYCFKNRNRPIGGITETRFGLEYHMTQETKDYGRNYNYIRNEYSILCKILAKMKLI